MNEKLFNIETITSKEKGIIFKINHDSLKMSLEKTLEKYLFDTLNDETKENIKYDIINTINQYNVFKELKELRWE